MLSPRWHRDEINIGDGQELLQGLLPASVGAVFFDPQYRALNDRQAYGDEKTPGSKMAKVHALRGMPEWMIKNMIIDVERALRPWGHLYMWIDKYMLVQGVQLYLGLATKLHPVDMIVWDKVRMGMGYRSRRRSEYLVVLQKTKNGDTNAKSSWLDHGIPDVWAEPAKRGGHPHAKPIELMARLILATTQPGDLVVDPCAGSYASMEAAAKAGRSFLGCDLLLPP